MVCTLCIGACKTRKGKKPSHFPWAFTVSGDPIMRTDWTWFSGRASLDYSDGTQEIPANINLRMKRDSIIWLSVSGPLGIQVARMYMTKDSLHFINYLQNSYGHYGVDYLSNFTGATLDIRSLQNLFIGNPLFDTLAYTKQDAGWMGLIPPVSNSIILNSDNFTDTSIVSEKGTLNSIHLDYEGWLLAGTISVPQKINALVNDKSNQSKALIQWKTVSDAPVYQYPFSIPNGYEQK